MHKCKFTVGPIRAKDLVDAGFLEHFRRTYPDDRVTPDARDYDHFVDVLTNDEASEQYRMAQARTLMRTYRKWKACLNS
jgi:hypothetical protein